MFPTQENCLNGKRICPNKNSLNSVIQFSKFTPKIRTKQALKKRVKQNQTPKPSAFHRYIKCLSSFLISPFTKSSSHCFPCYNPFLNWSNTQILIHIYIYLIPSFVSSYFFGAEKKNPFSHLCELRHIWSFFHFLDG